MRNSRRVTTSEFVAYIGNQEVAEAQFGFIVSKAVGTAVTRNRVKRQLRAAVASKLANLKPVAVVIRANPAAARADFSQILSSMNQVLEAA